jgi:hypothetical protein
MTTSYSSGAGRKRHHHFLPVFHLKYFIDTATAGVWTHDRRGRMNPNPKCIPPLVVGAEQELYTVETEEGVLSDAYEDWLADAIDGPAAAAIPKLLDNQVLTRGERSAIAAYVMSRDLRTPKAREIVLGIEQRAADSAWAALKRDVPATRARINADGGPDFSDEEITYYLEILAPEAANGAFTAFMARHINDGARRLYAMNWLIVDALIGQDFITSDLGILKFRGGWHDPVPHALGWIAKAEGWVVPLTPHTALVVAPGGDRGRGIATPEFLSLVNRELAAQAHQLVFARRPTPWVTRSWSQAAAGT